ncbi:MAG TPA: division/cell wall cluster transcriptional repressor MraZ [Polyangiaceae bacterium]|nr:division/cell wall cluster transcriptional repressor MraZ [Polyangiaceae bacterium]
MFRGQFQHSVDAKGRISVPARFRELLTADGTTRFIVTPAAFDPCLHVYPMRAWEEFERKISDLPSLDANVTRFRRIYVSAAVECELDAAGRLLVPPALRERARLEKDAIWAGMGRVIELWSKPEFDRSLTMTADEAAAFRAAMEQMKL